jgi:hypothetical protein
MNLKISKNAMRFRVSRQEFEQLLQAEKLSVPVPFLQAIHLQIEAANDFLGMNFTATENAWLLQISKTTLDDFAKSLPSREGLEQNTKLNNKEILLAFEVDVKKGR